MEQLNDSGTVTRTAQAWLEEVKRFERRGELLSAYDVAGRGLEEHPNDRWLQHRAVLALARAGATETARRQYAQFRLEEHGDEDIAALGARLLKDAALLASGPERTSLAEQAANKYAAIYKRTRGYYPAINAATLKLVAWKIPEAHELAREILALLAAKGESTDDAYYRAATEAEAHLILRDEERAADALRRALATGGADLAARAVTRKQLRLVGELTGAELSLLDLFETPSVIHFCGHIISLAGKEGRFPADLESQVAQQIAGCLDRENVGFGYGSLAAGADILFAEALLARGAELHVVLPFNPDEFLDTSVRPAGAAWERRFRHCLGRANAVSFATQDSYLGDDGLFSYCSSFAMGLALLRARYLDGDAKQVAVWDGEEQHGTAGTGADVAAWRRLELPQTILSVPGLQAAEVPSPPAVAQVSGRTLRAMLFGDVKGFSKLTDRQLPTFVHEVLGAMARALSHYEESICFRNTWGDGIFLVVDDIRRAASCALDLQAAIAGLGLTQLDMPHTLALRLGGHYGPVYEATDPIVGSTNYFGAHVSRAARIEPITPEGSVYVTEPFAAILALETGSEFACDYVGSVPAAKGYGVLPMYLLRRRTGD